MNEKIKNLKIEFVEEVDGTYIVKVDINDQSYLVECQTYMTDGGDESYLLSANNESGSDFSGSGLFDYIKSLGFYYYDEEIEEIRLKIEECAEEHIPENSVIRVLSDKLDKKLTPKNKKILFGAFGPSKVHHDLYQSECGSYIVASINYIKIKAENQLLGWKEFDTVEEYDAWVEEMYGEDNYGDSIVSYRAWKYICDGGLKNDE